MTKADFVGIAYLRITGGKPSTDNSVTLEDIKALIPSAVNYAMDKTYNINLEQNGDRDVPSEFYATYEDQPIVRPTGKRPYVNLVNKVVSLKVGAGIRFVYDNCGEYYSPLSDADMPIISYYEKKFKGTSYYRREKTKLNLFNINPMAKLVNYQSITSIDDIGDDDELPLQAGAEMDVLNILIELATGQRQMPYDGINNTKDINVSAT